MPRPANARAAAIMNGLCCPAPAPCASTSAARGVAVGYTDNVGFALTRTIMPFARAPAGGTMTAREKAFWIVAVPLAVAMAASDARLGAAPLGVRQEPTAQPMASRSGIELASLDRSANPCTDFYQFTCGGWMANHPTPPDQPRYGRFEQLQDRNNAILRDILDEAAKPSSAADMRQIGDYYASCMDQATIEAKGLAPLKPELDSIAAIKSLADLPPFIGHLHTLSFNPLFGFGSAPDFENASQYIATFGQGGMALPDRDYYLKDDANSAQLRDQYVQHVSRIFQLAGDPAERATA